MKQIQTILVLLLATLFTLLAPPRVFATLRTWSGNTDGNFSTAANWGGTAPVTGDTLIFGAAGTASSSLTADQAAGIVYGTMTFNGTGAFTIGGANGFVLGTSTAATSMTVSGNGAQTINSPFTLGNANQTFSLSGANLTLGGAVTANGTGTTLTLTGTKALTTSGGLTLGTASGNMALGNLAASTSTLNIQNNVTALSMAVGGSTGSGAVYQSGGTVALSSTTADGCLSLAGVKQANSSVSYGYYNMSGGTLNVNNVDVEGRVNGSAVMDVTGGTVNVQTTLNIARDNGTASQGVLNISGGTVNFGTVTTSGTVGFATQHADFGVLDVGGGAGSAALVGGANAVGGIQLSVGNVAATSIVNLLANGTVTTPRVFVTAATPSVNSLLNFNGGTLKATTVNAGSTFVTGLKAVTVFGNGGTIDNNGTSITVGNALITPTVSSVGVTGVSGLSGGSGYIGAPVVQFTGGTANNGNVATAVAIMSGGAVSSIQITSPGDYSVAPTGMSFTGGGATTAATITSLNTAANTSGNMTFQGSGATTLSGANTYTGNTTVKAGTLLVNNTTGNGAVIVNGSGAALGGSGTISGATIISNNAVLMPRPSGGSATTLTFSGNLTLTNASANFNLSSSAGGSNDKVVGVSQLTVDSTVTFNITASGGLDTGSDYQMISSSSLNTGAGGTPVLYVNGVLSDQLSDGNYKLLVTASGVALHYLPVTVNTPVIDSATFSPNPGQHNGSSILTVLVTPSSGHAISSISVATDNIGGAGDPASLTRTDANGPGLQETWVGTFNVSANKAFGTYTVGGIITQSDGDSVGYSSSLTVSAAMYVWNGNAAPRDSNWSTGNNWVSGAAPGLGDSVDFSGNNGLNPDMDQAYSLDSLTFDSLATATFTIGGSSTLTLSDANPIVNNSTTNQVMNVPMTLTNAVTINAVSGDLTLGGAVTVNGAASALTLTGTKALTTSGGLTLGAASNNNLMVGNLAGSTSTLNIQSNVTAFYMQAGGATGSGAVYQSGGTVTINSGTADQCLNLAGARLESQTSGYGYYNMSGGTLNVVSLDVEGRANGSAVMDVSGGTINITSGCNIARDNGTASQGVLNISGGTVNFGTVTANNGTIGFATATAGDFGVLNVGGGSGSAALVGPASASSLGVQLSVVSSTATGIVNLLTNGVVTTPRVSAATNTPNTLLNFNGGTLKATTVNAGGSFVTNLTAVTVFGNGGTIDNNGTSITISSALITPTVSSVGVTGVSGLSGGSGYIGAPVVQFTGGTANNGNVATAVAIMSGGAVSSIQITSPGDYSAAPTGVSFTGGGASSAASVSGISTSANTSGGMTFQGSGVTTLSGANTYTGSTVVSSGVLGGNGSIAGEVIVDSGAALAPGTSIGTLTLNNSPVLNGQVIMEVNPTNAQNADQLVLTTGTLNYGGTLTVTNLGSEPTNGTIFALFNAPAYSGSFSVTNLPPGGAAHWNANNLAVNGTLLFTNNPPVAGAGFTMGATLGVPATVQILGGKYPPTDLDGDALTITSVTGATNGTLTTDGTNITYTATNGVADSFIYTVGDGYGGTASQTINVSINTTGQDFNLLSEQIVDGNAVLGFAGIPGYKYALEWTHGLTPPVVWTPLMTNTAALGNGSLLYTNTPSGSNDFYRTRYVMP